MISFALPRFCDQSLDRSRKERFYPGAATPGWRSSTRSSTSSFTSTRIRTASGASTAATAPTRRTATAPLLRTGRRDGDDYLDTQPDPAASTIFCGTTSRPRGALRRRHRHHLPDVPVVSAALHRARGRAAAVRGRHRKASRSSRSVPRSSEGVHRRRPARAALHAGAVEAPDPQGSDCAASLLAVSAGWAIFRSPQASLRRDGGADSHARRSADESTDSGSGREGQDPDRACQGIEACGSRRQGRSRPRA